MVPNSYLTSTKNLDGILGAVQKAGVPANFTYDFLKQLGYSSSSDRPIIPVLKSLRFLASSGAPLERYKRYRDPKQGRQVMAEALRDAYADVFAVDQKANELKVDDLQGLFARLTNKSESITNKMAMTFKALADRSNFVAPPVVEEAQVPVTPTPNGKPTEPEVAEHLEDRDRVPLRLHHDIHVHLPESTEIEVYDAIFRALRQNFGD